MTKEIDARDRRLLHAKKIWQELMDMEARHEDERRAYIAGLLDGELDFLVSDADLFGRSNCGWWEYAAMHKGAAEARCELGRRPRTAVPA